MVVSVKHNTVARQIIKDIEGNLSSNTSWDDEEYDVQEDAKDAWYGIIITRVREMEEGSGGV